MEGLLWFLAGLLSPAKSDSKIKKHQEIVTLAIAKRDTVDRMVSKGLADKQIFHAEFQSIMTEYSQNHALKEASVLVKFATLRLCCDFFDKIRL